MRAVPLLYHDVVKPGEFERSGFPGGDANIYKLEREAFGKHLDAIARVNRNVVLTFDDGGVSGHDHIADALEQRGWRGHFFIATNWIGKPGFLNASQIRDLRRRGHQIGTHSCSHPPRISQLSLHDIVHEWADSADALCDILGERVQSGSVPGGFYSSKVAKAAAMAGLQTLFTSEPTLGAATVDGCEIVGRFTIQQKTPPGTAAALACGAALPRLKQSAYWNTKKVLKVVGGNAWLALRKRMLSRHS